MLNRTAALWHSFIDWVYEKVGKPRIRFPKIKERKPSISMNDMPIEFMKDSETDWEVSWRSSPDASRSTPYKSTTGKGETYGICSCYQPQQRS